MITLLDILKSREFHVPALLSLLLLAGLATAYAPLYGIAIAIGAYELLKESLERIRERRWNLDYVAFLALLTAVFLNEWLAGSVLALMVAVSAALETYGTVQAKKTLRGLFEKLPKSVLVKRDTGTKETAIQSVRSGEVLLIRPHEMLAFDGYLASPRAVLDEAALTGEMEPVDYQEKALLKSGSLNVGEPFELVVRGDFEHSSYRRILRLVEEGKVHPSPLVRLAERGNVWFTVLTLLFAVGAFAVSGEWNRFLAVLVIATPCPLLIAAPLSFIGGLNKAARKNIIVKSPFVLELLAKTKTLFFDKTGTLTLGIPRLGKIEAFDPSVGETEALSLAAALERHSFHPIAKSFVAEQGKRGGAVSEAENVEEKIGEGMFGEIGGRRYGVVKAAGISDNGIVVELVREGVPIARFFFDDELKEDVGRVFGYLRERGYRLGILTGDKKANAERLFGHFRLPIYASCSPEKKMTLVTRAQQKGELVGMIGDGMNDAPALALADVGIVFSGTENSASTEAADVAILERDAWLIRDAVHIGRRSYHVALQSILIGIGLSTAGMLFAFFGFISPITGAVLQEVIDAVVIVNALRSTY